HVDGIDRTAEQFFKRYNPKDPQKGGAQKLTADVLGMGKAQLQLYRQKTEELINDSLMRYAPTKMVEIKGIQVEVPSLVSCLSNKEYNKKHGTQLKDVPVMNKAVRFAREKEPELMAEREKMTAEINRLRAENHYELYRSFYEAELKNRKEIEELSTQAETPRTRQHWYAQEKLLFLQQKMLQALLQDRQMTEPFRVIQHDLQTYIDLLNIESFDRLEKFEYLTDLGQQLKNSVIQIASIEEELAFMQRQVIERVPLQMREKAVTPDKIRNHDQDNDFSPGF
ncbi:hypothetical protein, partial [Acinetobacter sp. YH16031]|uniref:hypothetical protein n=1 Tax=Acinetobacter sp. YH16031 TaxID=2601180 RepID=UPI0015D36798